MKRASSLFLPGLKYQNSEADSCHKQNSLLHKNVYKFKGSTLIIYNNSELKEGLQQKYNNLLCERRGITWGFSLQHRGSYYH
jgi:hypothetical protein